MTILSGLSLFSLFSSQSKNDRLRKSIVPISNVLKRQPLSSTPQRALPKSSGFQQYRQDGGASNANGNKGEPEVITENSILRNYPRPNLMPTLHYSLFGYQSPTEGNKNRTTVQCSNCSGPHSTSYCPC
ncbi:hypothetical protein BDF20DRAFT_831902 [Mycotypha africana]|uniref:uncharacterized protein n=1 Tax=Mycotypha africana TaxID=64632 RepID=UPI002301308D|nr:uncharacterized protein BDF20DRAFT_831902 [Mycotypha africana]KAI8991904.1 hypothetical protein BDF20DRAFT_831902 [Mycotypha africana]